MAATAPDAARRPGQSVVVAPECRHARARRPTADVTGRSGPAGRVGTMVGRRLRPRACSRPTDAQPPACPSSRRTPRPSPRSFGCCCSIGLSATSAGARSRRRNGWRRQRQERWPWWNRRAEPSGYSVTATVGDAAMAALSVCHGRLAHLIRTGNSRTPPSTMSLPSDGSPDG